LREEIITLLGFLIAPSNGQTEPPAGGLTSRPRSFLNALTGALIPDSNGNGNGNGEQTRGETSNG
jgi:hypothetical protein